MRKKNMNIVKIIDYDVKNLKETIANIMLQKSIISYPTLEHAKQYIKKAVKEENINLCIKYLEQAKLTIIISQFLIEMDLAMNSINSPHCLIDQVVTLKDKHDLFMKKFQILINSACNSEKCMKVIIDSSITIPIIIDKNYEYFLVNDENKKRNEIMEIYHIKVNPILLKNVIDVELKSMIIRILVGIIIANNTKINNTFLIPFIYLVTNIYSSFLRKNEEIFDLNTHKILSYFLTNKKFYSQQIVDFLKRTNCQKIENTEV